MFSGIFIAEVDEVRDKESGGTTLVHVQTPLEAFLNMSLRPAYFSEEAFFWQKAKLLVLGLLSSRAVLSGFPNHQTLDLRNSAVN